VVGALHSRPPRAQRFGCGPLGSSEKGRAAGVACGCHPARQLSALVQHAGVFFWVVIASLAATFLVGRL
jgi:hypothetical protein